MGRSRFELKRTLRLHLLSSLCDFLHYHHANSCTAPFLVHDSSLQNPSSSSFTIHPTINAITQPEIHKSHKMNHKHKTHTHTHKELNLLKKCQCIAKNYFSLYDLKYSPLRRKFQVKCQGPKISIFYVVNQFLV